MRRLAQGHLDPQLGGAGDRTSNLPVTSQVIHHEDRGMMETSYARWDSFLCVHRPPSFHFYVLVFELRHLAGGRRRQASEGRVPAGPLHSVSIDNDVIYIQLCPRRPDQHLTDVLKAPSIMHEAVHSGKRRPRPPTHTGLPRHPVFTIHSLPAGPPLWIHSRSEPVHSLISQSPVQIHCYSPIILLLFMLFKDRTLIWNNSTTQRRTTSCRSYVTLVRWLFKHGYRHLADGK